MGQYYKTASAAPIDYAYRINAPLMEKVITNNDQYISNDLNQLSQLDTAAGSFGYLKPDEQRAKEITQDYYDKINALTSSITKDPANWRRQMEPIKRLSSDLATNYKTGEISKIAGNYNTYKTVSDSIDKQMEEYNKTGKGISADRALAYKNYYLNQFSTKNPKGTAYDPSTGQYNQMVADTPMSNIDIRAKLAEGLDKLKADGEIRVSDDLTKGGEYFNKITNKWEGITPDKILGIVADKLNDPQLTDYMKNDSRVGLIQGVYDSSGNYIQPYSYIKPGATEIENKNIQLLKNQVDKTKDAKTKSILQSQLDNLDKTINDRRQLKWNDQSFLAPILRGLVSEYSYNKAEVGNDLTNNSLYNTKYTQAMENSRDALNRSSREKLHGEDLAWKKEEFSETQKNLDDRLQKKLDADQKIAETKATTKPGTTPKKTDPKAPEAPKQTGISRIATASFENITTTDRTTGTKVPLLSLAGVTSSMQDLQEQKTKVDKTLTNVYNALLDKNIDPVVKANLVTQRATLEQKRKDLASDLGLRKTWYEKATEAALNNNPNTGVNLTPSELKLYNEFNSQEDINKLKDQIKEVAAKVIPRDRNVIGGEGMSATKPIVNDPNSDLLKSLNDRLQNYIATSDKVNKAKNNFLNKVRHDNIKDDAITPNEVDGSTVADMLLTSPQGLTIFDSNGDKPSSGKALDGKGLAWGFPSSDNYSFEFKANGTKGLSQYIKDNNVTMKINKIANTTGIGSGGAVVEVYFEDPNGEIPKGQPYYVELTPELQKTIGTKFKADKNPDVVNIANKLTDEEGNAIRKQFIKPHLNNASGESGQEPGTFNVFVNSSAGQKIPLNVIRFNDNDIIKLNVTMEDKNGKIVPFYYSGTDASKPLPPPNGTPGLFNGVEDFLEYYNKVPK